MKGGGGDGGIIVGVAVKSNCCCCCSFIIFDFRLLIFLSYYCFLSYFFYSSSLFYLFNPHIAHSCYILPFIYRCYCFRPLCSSIPRHYEIGIWSQERERHKELEEEQKFLLLVNP